MRHPSDIPELDEAAFGNNERPRVVRFTMTTIGIIGAGHIGSQVARAAIGAGYDVVIANSRGPETLADLVAELGPKARAATATDAAAAADVAVVTVPFKAYASIPVEPLAGKIVIDTNNYYWERDGRVPALDEGRDTVSGMLQKHLPSSRVAKGFNQIRSAEITTDGAPAGSPERRALATASDFDDAAQFVADLYEQIGFDTVNVGPLSESWRIERDQPAYVVPQTRDELVANLAKAERQVAAA
ncbi:NADPH-dependent F420 reductase [Agromyces laixinhei]|uniref:NADPH-dependent F420 reductase n=1 Tax=Agromyces laixinhei TaxID=2585717 RepID=UPI0012EEB43D|nr:NAD(P)-binding domain-containing protein [Agromyces laixinhei]